MMKYKYQELTELEDCVERIHGTRWNYWTSPFGRELSTCEPLPDNAVGYVPLPKEYWFNFDLLNLASEVDMVDFAVGAWESILSGRAISIDELLLAVKKYKMSHPPIGEGTEP